MSIKDWFKKSEVVGVQGPIEYRASLGGAAVIAGYDVIVRYRRPNGREYERTVRFPDENESLFTQYENPQQAARKYRDSIVGTMFMRAHRSARRQK